MVLYEEKENFFPKTEDYAWYLRSKFKGLSRQQHNVVIWYDFRWRQSIDINESIF